VFLSLGRIKPVLFASTDTEIWPNFRFAARMLGVKNAIINGTVSDKTMSGAKKIPWLYKRTLSSIDLFCMQCKADADRITALGAAPERVVVTGNCKADQSVEPMSAEEKASVRSWFALPFEAKVFVAGSTNPGEDEPVIDAFIKASNAFKGLKLIIAPRQIERKQEIYSIAESRGLKCALRSDNSASGDEDVFILDTFGELARVYGIADVTFVGGSLIPKGCHSILQPIAQGKPVAFGPYTFKAKDLVAQAKDAGVGFEISDSDELAGLISDFLGNPDKLAEVAKSCGKMMADNLGASRRTAEALVKLLSTNNKEDKCIWKE
jgi:3-deoxy-D-manno-octulosonic-acid transferase